MCSWVTTSGGAKCLGQNTSGQLGNGAVTDSSTPVDVVELERGVASISTGGGHARALMNTGQVKCWGSNSIGQLGDATTVDKDVPVDVYPF